MTKEEYVEQAKYLNLRIEFHKEKCEEYRKTYMDLTTYCPRDNKELRDEYYRLWVEHYDAYMKLLEFRLELEKVIDQVQPIEDRLFLSYLCLNGLGWDKVIEKMDIPCELVDDLMNQAINNIDLPKNPTDVSKL